MIDVGDDAWLAKVYPTPCALMPLRSDLDVSPSLELFGLLQLLKLTTHVVCVESATVRVLAEVYVRIMFA